MRKRATDGTKINTSPTMTKKMVRIRRRADRLFSSTSRSSAEAREKTHEPAGARREQCRRIVASCSALARLAARRVGHDQIGERTDLEALRNRQRPGQDQIAGPDAEDGGAEDAAVPPDHDLDETFGVPLGLGAVVLDERPSQHPDITAASARSGLG